MEKILKICKKLFDVKFKKRLRPIFKNDVKPSRLKLKMRLILN